MYALPAVPVPTRPVPARPVPARPVPARPPGGAAGRRRLLLALVTVALVVLALAVWSPAHEGPSAPAPAVLVSQRSYVVRPGDTLWSIVRALEPHGDVRPLVDRLDRSRRGRPLRAGERIVLP